MNKIKIIIIAILFLFFFSKDLLAINSKILVKIHNQTITNYDLNKQIDYLNILGNKRKDNLNEDTKKKIALKLLIEEQIKKNEIIKMQIKEVNNKELNKSLNQIVNNLGYPNLENFNIILKKNNYSLDDFKVKIQNELLWKRLIYMMYNNQVIVDEELIKNKIEKIKKNKKINEYLLSEILIRGTNKKEVVEKIKKVYESIKIKGFDETAVKFSSSSSAKYSGNLGWVNENQISEKLVMEINKLNINHISDPIPIPGGILIIKLSDKRSIENELDLKKNLDELVLVEKNKQLDKFSSEHYQKLLLIYKVENING